jgi:hypothetical protein
VTENFKHQIEEDTWKGNILASYNTTQNRINSRKDEGGDEFSRYLKSCPTAPIWVERALRALARITGVLRARLHGSPRLINAVESITLNSTVERYCLHGSTKVNEAVDSKMGANEFVREGVVICGYLIKECQHILEKRNTRKKRHWWVKLWIVRRNTRWFKNYRDWLFLNHNCQTL